MLSELSFPRQPLMRKVLMGYIYLMIAPWRLMDL